MTCLNFWNPLKTSLQNETFWWCTEECLLVWKLDKVTPLLRIFQTSSCLWWEGVQKLILYLYWPTHQKGCLLSNMSLTEEVISVCYRLINSCLLCLLLSACRFPTHTLKEGGLWWRKEKRKHFICKTISKALRFREKRDGKRVLPISKWRAKKQN